MRQMPTAKKKPTLEETLLRHTKESFYDDYSRKMSNGECTGGACCGDAVLKGGCFLRERFRERKNGRNEARGRTRERQRE